jgi:endonuclease YncB( thermonuclease family)
MKMILVVLFAVAMLAGCAGGTRTGALKAGAPVGVEFSGKVVEVHDGDTIVVDVGDGRRRVRLAEIDAPELAQPFGPESKAALEKRVAGKTVRVTWSAFDKWGRVVGNVYHDGGRWANNEMLACGMAWQYKEYSKDENLARLEAIVRSRKLGLWSQAAPQAPWDYRKAKKED